MSAAPRTLLDKIWERHAVVEREDGRTLLYVDRHLIHDGSRRAFEVLGERGLKVSRPDRPFGTPDHYGPTTGRDIAAIDESDRRQMGEALGRNRAAHGIPIFGLHQGRQASIHRV